MWAHLVRHAVAEKRKSWSDPDELRPLDRRGRHQAHGLIGQRDWSDVTAVMSSPAVRCVQTVAPLAEHLGRQVDLTDALMEGGDGPAVLEVASRHRDGDLVLCSHGDVIPEVLAALARRGTELPADRPCAKGSTWSVEVNDGEFVRAVYTPPPG